ncbi:TetR/AcrR family transcriptional regulator [Streptomyces sp. NBC_01142]|uniref:TetR/AcrR family transcriptional regulator n=1 Tax=Streptomyces sp. NBC_01142 TaxID=2975865 RepID=UPI002258414E|nr:TetR/AcrR family transcriptional regulator [Streptomyces sp. NBC_01142]MCX4825717.1 TetR/AcrR family transcriptional regulator [Streptomyces sp. NBC_01142]
MAISDRAGTPRAASAPPARRTDARLNRARLLAAAQEVFAEAGPEASLNEIARRADIGPGTLYRHFPHRTALLSAVLSDRIEALCGQAEKLLSSDSADDAPAQWLRAFLAHARVNHGMGGAMLVDESSAPEEPGAPAPTATGGSWTRPAPSSPRPSNREPRAVT